MYIWKFGGALNQRHESIVFYRNGMLEISLGVNIHAKVYQIAGTINIKAIPYTTVNEQWPFYRYGLACVGRI